MIRSVSALQRFLAYCGWWDARLFLGTVLLCEAPPLAFAEETKVSMQDGALVLRGGKLTAQVTDVPLQRIMEQVSALSGGAVIWNGEGPNKRVSAGFTDLPFSEALTHLLPGQSFMLLYDDADGDKTLRQIVITSKEKTGGPSLLPNSPTSSVPMDLAVPPFL
jgi:hypothetical protein